MTVSKQLVSRFKSEFTGRLIAMVSSGLLMVVLARILGPTEYGLLFLAISIFGVLGIGSKLGIAKSCARYVTEYKQTDPSQIPHILRISMLFNIGTILVVGLGLSIGYRHLSAVLGEPSLIPFLLLGVLFLPLEALATFTRLVLQGFEKIKFAATLHAVNRVSRLVFAVGFVVLGFGAIGALVGYILSFVVVVLPGLWIVYRRFYRGHAAATMEPGLRRRIGEYTVPLTATSTANVLDKRVDTILIGFFLTPVAVAYYELSKQIIEFLETPVSALGFTLSPSFGAQKADGNIDRAARVYEEALVHSLLLYIPAAAGLVLVAEPTLGLVFGDEYLGAVTVLQVLSLYVILQAITKITSNGLDFLGRARDRSIVKGITAVLNVGLNVVLIPQYGVVGAAIATVVTYSMYTAANVFIIHQEFGLRLGHLFRRITVIISVTLVMAAVVSSINDSVNGWASLAGIVTLGIAIWATLSIATGLLDVQKIRSGT